MNQKKSNNKAENVIEDNKYHCNITKLPATSSSSRVCYSILYNHIQYINQIKFKTVEPYTMKYSVNAWIPRQAYITMVAAHINYVVARYGCTQTLQHTHTHAHYM